MERRTSINDVSFEVWMCVWWWEMMVQVRQALSFALESLLEDHIACQPIQHLE